MYVTILYNIEYNIFFAENPNKEKKKWHLLSRVFQTANLKKTLRDPRNQKHEEAVGTFQNHICILSIVFSQ